MPYKDKAKQAAWYQRDKREHPEKYKAAYERSKNKTRRLQRGLKKLTVSIATIEAIWLAQNKCCAICKKELPFRGKDTCMDHNHQTLQLRGVLCAACNLALGQFKEDPIRLLAAIEYVNKYNGQGDPEL